jgi:hypothetical protein
MKLLMGVTLAVTVAATEELGVFYFYFYFYFYFTNLKMQRSIKSTARLPAKRW